MLGIVLLLGAPFAGAETPAARAASRTPRSIDIVPEHSVFAVVTQKAGIGAKLAHNHLVVAEGYRASLGFEEEDPGSTVFELVAPVDSLVVDRGDFQKTWGRRVQELGLVAEPFQALSDKDRGKIRKSMLSAGQLAAEDHPQIRARVLGVEPAAEETLGDRTFGWKVRLEVSLKGKTVEGTALARYGASSRAADLVEFEAVGSFRFTDFGIEPYSALFGAIRNDDEFHLYVFVTGRRLESPEEDVVAPASGP